MKYRLIETYPGYEILGETHCSENKTPEWKGTKFYDAHPKYWQKVEEVDYEITEVMYSGQRRFLHEGFYRIFIDGVGFELDYLLKNGATIFSVKRLSDGEVFTIKDFTSLGEIMKFTICKNKEMIAEFNGNSGFSNIKFLDKLPNKTPLFTTEDGKEIFEGDEYHFVTENFTINSQNCSKDHKELTVNSKNIRFSTKEKAEEYILLNKPCLCLNDLKTIWEGANFPIEVSVLFKRFKKLAKSKL